MTNNRLIYLTYEKMKKKWAVLIIVPRSTFRSVRAKKIGVVIVVKDIRVSSDWTANSCGGRVTVFAAGWACRLTRT